MTKYCFKEQSKYSLSLFIREYTMSFVLSACLSICLLWFSVQERHWTDNDSQISLPKQYFNFEMLLISIRILNHIQHIQHIVT